MSEREINVGWVSPKGVTQRRGASVHSDVGLRDEAANPICGTRFDESAKLEKVIKTNLKGLGYGG